MASLKKMEMGSLGGFPLPHGHPSFFSAIIINQLIGGQNLQFTLSFPATKRIERKHKA